MKTLEKIGDLLVNNNQKIFRGIDFYVVGPLFVALVVAVIVVIVVVVVALVSLLL